MKAKLLILLLIVFFSTTNAQNVMHSDPYNITYEPNVVLLKVKDDVNTSAKLGKVTSSVITGITELDELLQEYKVKEINKVFTIDKESKQKKLFKDYYGNEHEAGKLEKIYKLKYEEEIDAKELSQIIAENENIEYAEPDFHFYVNSTETDDPLYVSGAQWHINAVNAPEAWDLTTGDTTQVIAILDTGVDWDHPDLDDNIWINYKEIPGNGIDDDGNGYIDDIRGWDFVNNDNDPNDDNSHGTHAAGIAAAEGNNGVGVCGINWHAKIMAIKVMQSSGRGNSSDIAAGVNFARQNGATVINMSIGSYGESITLKSALENAYNTSVLVAAAGNDGYKVDPPPPVLPKYQPHYPACYSFVIGVEASDSDSKLAKFSNYDPSGPVKVGNSYNHNYEVKAPGVNIESTFPNGSYKAISGTSMASPLVAGAVSLLLTNNPQQSHEEVFARLIQGVSGGILNIAKSMTVNLVPNLEYLDYTIVDTEEGCDEDGIADAGETIELFLNIKNGGGYADSVWTKIRFGEYEDNSVAEIIDSTSYIGDISTYGQLSGERDPFKIKIDPNTANDRDIVFEIEFGCKDGSSYKKEIVINVQSGFELSGVYEGIYKLTPEHFYIVSENTVFDTLIIAPGTTIHMGENTSILIMNDLVAEGKPDSMIVFTHNTGYWNGIKNSSSNHFDIKYAVFEYHGGDEWGNIFGGKFNIYDSIFRNNINNIFNDSYGEVIRCIFLKNNAYSLLRAANNGFETKWNVLIDNSNNTDGPALQIGSEYNNSYVKENTCFNNITYKNNDYAFGWGGSQFNVFHLEPNYFGTTQDEKIESMIQDYFESSNFPVIMGDKALSIPPAEAHGFVWKVLVNGVDPQDEQLDPLGSGRVKFDLYFNRAMDTTITPFLTFGVREPYTQQAVIDNASWSSDSTIWTAYYDFGLETGDGINTIRVASAQDNEHFEIPLEYTRFKFTLQAAGAASTEFIADAGIGEVKLEWPYANTDDVLGYNMYRYYMVNDSTASDTTLLNTSLITDSVFVDYNVIPDTTYGYLYKVLGTDMVESDYSKSVTAVPYNATNGDANGDLTVNVLDITSIVSYLLNKSPEPFLTEAGDVNDDGKINVLDIVAAVNIIMGDKIVAKTFAVNGDPTLQYCQDGIALSNGANICAMQIKAVGQGLNNAKLVPSELLKRMEYAYNISNDTLYAVIFSLGNHGIGNDSGQLFSLTEGKITEISEVNAANKESELLSITISNGSELIPEEYQLLQNYPNPFNPNTTIKFGLPIVSDVEINIYNILGQRIKSYYLPAMTAGFHSVMWNSTNDHNRKISTGVYIYQIKAGQFIDSKKMLLLK